MPSIRVAAALATFGVAIAAPAAWADGYPFSGLFVFPADDVAAADAPLLCGYNFFTQNDDGTYENYHLDLPAYQKDHTIRFLLYARGRCTAENGRVETCRPSWDADKSVPVQDFVDVIKEIQPQKVTVSLFDRIEDARSFVANGKPPPTGASTYFRCPYDAAAIAKYRSESPSALTEKEREKLVVPEITDDARKAMTDVLTAIGARK